MMLQLCKVHPNYLFCNQVSSERKVPFFLIQCFEKNCQFWQDFVSRTSCPRTEHSPKVEVAHVNISGMESFQCSFGNDFSPHAIHCYYFHTRKHREVFKGQAWTKTLWFHNGGKFWLTQSNILSALHSAQNFICTQMILFCSGTRKNIFTHGKIEFISILPVLPTAGPPSLVLQLKLEAGQVLAPSSATAITGFHPLANALILPSQPPPRANSLKLGGLIRMHEVLQKWPGLRDNLSKYLSFLIFLNMLQIFRHLNSGLAVWEVAI